MFYITDIVLCLYIFYDSISFIWQSLLLKQDKDWKTTEWTISVLLVVFVLLPTLYLSVTYSGLLDMFCIHKLSDYSSLTLFKNIILWLDILYFSVLLLFFIE